MQLNVRRKNFHYCFTVRVLYTLKKVLGQVLRCLLELGSVEKGKSVHSSFIASVKGPLHAVADVSAFGRGRSPDMLQGRRNDFDHVFASEAGIRMTC